MAQCLQSVQEFIQDSFVPMVAVLCSKDAEQVTRKNNLNFSELVRPFCRLTSEGHMRDPNNQVQVIKNLKIHVSNIVTQPPQPAAIRKMLSEVVSVSQPAEGLVANVITAGDYDLNISGNGSSICFSTAWCSQTLPSTLYGYSNTDLQGCVQDSDLRSALLLEQSAHCFINMGSPMVRKFAFHMILAGHRFSKAGQKRHALRCYCQAMQVYKGKGWSLAEDHINFTIGRQSFTLKQLDNAVSAFRHILINDSKQTASQQGAFLREYLYVYKNVSQLSPDGPLPHLPLPCIQSSATRVFFGHDRRLAEGEKQAATHVSLDQEFDSELSQQWKELEEQVVAVVNRGAIPVNFQPTQYCLNSQTDNFRFPLAVVEEPIIVEVVFRNPLKVPLLLTDLSLLGKFQSKDFGQLQNREEPKSNEKDAHGKATFNNEFISTDVILEFSMGSEETKVARLKLLPHQTGELHILGVVYNLGTVPFVNVVDGTDPSSGLQGDVAFAYMYDIYNILLLPHLSVLQEDMKDFETFFLINSYLFSCMHM
ncbi:UNVERIFIED_CONTAM: hypothetical protein FKN15_059220 [Acipenser sinensis]